jgi:hypothetical protein
LGVQRSHHLQYVPDEVVDSIAHLIPEIRAFRPFLPAREFKTSLRFYETIGFDAYPSLTHIHQVMLSPK